VKIYVAAVEALRKNERQYETQLTTKIGLVEKLGSVPVISFHKISFPVKRLMPYYAETDRSRPPNSLTLQR
jgi:hypothetical protein